MKRYDVLIIIHRRDAFRAQPIIQERALANPKIEVRWNTIVEAIKGQNHVEAVVLRSTVGEERWELPVGGTFIFIGFSPNQIKDHANHDQLGFFLTDERMQTSVPGLFAVGDIRAQPVRQITNATGARQGTAVTVNGSVPGPLLRLREGETVAIRVMSVPKTWSYS